MNEENAANQWQEKYRTEKKDTDVHHLNAFRAGWRAANRENAVEVRESGGQPESPNHYSRLKALTGVETWDILDFVAGNDPDMWNLGKYWFRMGHKEGQSTLTEKKKMLKYLERSIEKEESSTE